MTAQNVGKNTIGLVGGCRATAAGFAAVLVCSAAVSAAEVPWRSGAARIAARDGRSLTEAVAVLAERADARHVVVQFSRPITTGERERLGQAGLELLAYVGSESYFASLAAGGVDAAALGAIPFVAGLADVQPAWKLDPRLLDGQVPQWAVVGQNKAAETMVGLYVLFHGDVSLFSDGIGAVQRYGAEVRDELEAINGLVIEMPLANVEALAAEDAVQWIEFPLPPFDVVNDGNRVRTQADLVQAAPYNLNGSGVTALIYDGGTARATHVDFQGRLTVLDASGQHYHSTHVAGTVGGAGVANPLYKGMAPAVTLLSYGFQYDGTGIFLYSNPGDIAADYGQAINTYGADIANNSIGTNTETNGFDCTIQGNYGVTDVLIDTIVRGDGSNPTFNQPFRVVWANGNERQGSRCDIEGYGDYYSTAPPAGAKNHITVGALNSNDDSMTSFSSWGPVDDGRMKPDISAPGCQSNGDGGVTSVWNTSDTAYGTICGTSMASPTVCGISALVMQDYRAQFPTQPDMRNSTLKILLAHTAVDLGNVGPDYQYGYGSVRVKDAIDFMRTQNFLEDQVSQGDVFQVLVSVDAGEQLKVTLAWDDYPGTPNVNPALVNDLDLRVYDPSMTQHYPWTLNPTSPASPAVRTQADHVNNIEQVKVDAPTPGVWRVEVYGYNVPQGPQPFSLCASPQLVACSPQGMIQLDASRYPCTATPLIQVVDCDLNTDNGVIETVTVTVSSDSEPAGEPVVLTETAPETADFRGTAQLSETDSPGVVLVADRDTLTATYIDADDGQGGINVPVVATALMDCGAPVISNVQVVAIGDDTATVTFDTDEPAIGTVRYGLSCGALTLSESDADYETSHSLVLTGLSFDTPYFFAVDAVDDQSNLATDDNGGACYTFSTPGAIYEFPMDTDPGWTTEGAWAFGQPTGQGGQYGGPDPTSGYTGLNVYGYNLSGDYANNLPQTHLTSTALDCTGLTGLRLRFWRWLGVEQSAYDHAYVRISNNGTTWTTLWQNSTQLNGSPWTFQEFDISAVADNQPTVYLRWTMGTTDSSWKLCGWNIDDVQIVGVGGVATCDDGVLNQDEDRIDCGGPCPPCACTSDSACDNGAYCDGAESCDAYGECQAGSAVDCTDGVGCTDDSCNETTDSCDNVPNDGSCDNGLYCDGVETCDAVLDCQAGSAVDCADGVTCTDDSCNEATDSCDNVPNDGLCDNGLYCDGVETCDALLDCQAGSAVDCADGVTCTDDSCNETTDSCDNVPNDGLCDNGLYCDGVETCDPPLDCQTGDDPCSVGEWCNEAGGQCLALCDALTAYSCRDHSTSGLLCLEVGLANGIEPRFGGVTALDFNLVDAGGFGGGVTVDCSPTPYTGLATHAGTVGNVVTIGFSPGLPEGSVCTVTLDCGAQVCVRNLEGDSNLSGVTNATDNSQRKLLFGEAASAANAAWDVNVSGLVNATDNSQSKLRFGNTAPACP